ncbi:MAG: radical SAM protein [Verrucomicrobia bacterium]|nr:radical SAM protein [Verrucomicrobiota bacterium]
MNAVASFLYHLGIDSPRKWHPLLSVYYLTYACDFRCPHCSDGVGKPYYRLRSPTLSGSRVLDLLRIIRRHSEYLVITGGEPLQHPDFREVMEGLGRLNFRGVILTTNGVALDSLLPAVAPVVTELVVSLQTLDSERADAWYGLGMGTHRRVLANLEQAARHPGRKFEIVISSVVTPENIGDLYGVYHFAKQRGFRLAVCPQLVGVKAHASLAGSPAYRQFYDFLIAEKKRGGRVQGTVDYLEYMRDLRQFACRPFTMLVVSPVGEVFYPCLELGNFAGNLFNEPDLHRLRQAGCACFGPQPKCGTQCHSACALGFSRFFENPASVLHEAALWTRARFRSAL